MSTGDSADSVSERLFILLSDDDRFVRKKALTELNGELKRITEGKDTNTFPFSSCAPRLTNTLNDSVEVNRELAVQVNREFLVCAPDVSVILPSLLPVLVKRLGQKEPVEPSEELRLDCLKLVSLVVSKQVDLNPYVDDLLIILKQSLLDAFHEVKKLSCSILQELSSKKCHRFYQNSEVILGPLLGNLVHQHSKVRLSTVFAVGHVLMNSQGKLVEQAIAPLTQRLFDTAVAVRKGVIEVVGLWLLDLPDRYSFHTKLLPLILSGLIDSSDEIKNLTEDYWHEIGLKFQNENEEQLKDKLDFDQGTPFHYPLGCRRANMGCRELVYRSASRLLPALCRDLGDWQAATRSKAAGLISVLLLHLETATTQHTQHLLSGLASGMADVISRIAPTTNSVALLQLLPPVAYRDIPSASGDLSVNQTGTESLVPRLPAVLQSGSAEVVEALTMTQQLLLASQLIGTLVESKLWWPLMKSCLERCTESVAPSSLAGHLFLLAGLIRGSSIVQLAMPELGAKNASDSNKVTATMLYDIVQYLAQDDLLAVISFGSKAALLECILVVIRRLEECVVNLQSSSANRETNESTPGNLESVGTEVNRNASTVLLLNTQLQSNLYVILLALGAVWADGDSAGTDFGTALIQLTDNGMRRLAACARDQAQVRADESNKEQTTAPAPTPSAIATTATTTSDNLRTWQTNLLAPASASDIDQLHNKYIFPLFQRLDADCTRSGSWHPRSVGLAIFSRCVQLAGPALLLSTVGSDSAESLSPLSSNTCLSVALQLLERGCRLDRKPGCDAEKAPGGTDPLTMASEAELRLRGLMLLTRLTDNTAVRNTLASPDYLSRCLTRLVLPACVWRAGRTAEAMRKAATTCLVALIAAATTIYDIDEASVDARTEDEVRLDAWLSDRSEPIRRLLGPKTEKLKRDNRTPRTSTLPKLTAAVLSKLLSRIGGLLEDDLEATRRMACLNVTLLFNGFLLPCAGAEEGSSDNSLFLASSTWLMPFKESDSSSTASPANESKPANVSCPLPNSFGDQVYRFYPNLIKRLNDAKDEIRLLVTESLNAWLRVVRPMLVCDQSPENSTAHRARLNPVHSAIIEDFLNGLLPHLDDLDDQIRAAVARVFARLCQFAPELCGRILHGARGRQRSPEFCDLLLQVVCND